MLCSEGGLGVTVPRFKGESLASHTGWSAHRGSAEGRLLSKAWAVREGFLEKAPNQAAKVKKAAGGGGLEGAFPAAGRAEGRARSLPGPG